MTLTDVLKTRVEYAQSLDLKTSLIIDNPSGPAYIEVGGTTNAFIDLKSPYSNDFDVRLGTIGGTSGTLETSSNQPLTISSGTGNVNIQPDASGKVGIGISSPTEKLHVSGGVKATSLQIEASSGIANIEVGGPSGAYIDLKGPFSDDLDMRVGSSGNGGYISTSGNTNILLQPGGSGNVAIGNIKTYANNAAAIAGGLAVNDVYKTATGELRIVV